MKLILVNLLSMSMVVFIACKDNKKVIDPQPELTKALGNKTEPTTTDNVR